MTPRLDAIGITTKDMTSSFAFYRSLGFEIPQGLEEEPHAEITLPNGLRFMWDSVELTSSLHEGYKHAPNHNLAAFLCASPVEVDTKFDEVLLAGGRPVKAPWDAFWGSATRRSPIQTVTSWICSHRSSSERAISTAPLE